MKYAARTNKGLVRENNEDFFYLDEKYGLYIVADGIGGHNAGEVASRVATETIRDIFAEGYETRQEALPGLICDAIKEANRVVYGLALKNNSYFGMGTTVTMLAEKEGIAYIGHIGDSRAYLVSKENGRLITSDHTLVNELLKKGTISEEDAKLYPNRNIITKALGTDPETMPDLYEVELETGDVLMICSDGLSDLVDDNEMYAKVRTSENLDAAAEALVTMALEAGGFDNITVMLLEYVGKSHEVGSNG